MKVQVVTLLASALCDLHCKYCYIPQDITMKKVHEDLLEKIKNENFLDPILKVCDDVREIEHIGLWGLEPTKVLNILSERFDYIFNTLPNLKEFGFSSNFQGDTDRIINFIKKIGNKRKITIGIQASLDGMPKINDMTRGKGSGNRIILNLKKLVKDLEPVLKNQPNITISLSDKGTLNSNVLELYEKNPGLLIENYKFMNGLFEELYTFRKPNLNMSFGGSNAECPFEYSKDHGIYLYHLLQNLDELIHKENLKCIMLPFYGKIQRIVKFGSEFNNKHFMFTCNANRGNLALGVEKDVFTFCHRDFFPTESESIIKFKKEYYGKHFDSKNKERQEYLESCYTHFPKLHLEQIIIMCKELAYCGLINKEYMDYDTSYLLALFLASENCSSVSLDLYCSPYITNIGYMKLMGNGAFDYLLKKVINE